MSANALPSGVALSLIAIVALSFSAGVVLWHRFGPSNRTLHNLLEGLSPQFARLITADYAEQVLGAEPDEAVAQLAYLGLATSRAYALGRATLPELHAVTRALSRAYGPDFAKIAGQGAVDDAMPEGEPDLVDLARRLGVFGFPAQLGGGFAVNYAADKRHPDKLHSDKLHADKGHDGKLNDEKLHDEKLHLSVPAGGAGPFVGKAVACACADEPKAFLAAQYARGAWKNKQAVEAFRKAPLDLGLPGAGGLWSVRSGHSTIAGARSAKELIDSQIELAGHYAYSGPAALASLTRANAQFGQAERSQAEQSQLGGPN
jgi:hypothetical protein